MANDKQQDGRDAFDASRRRRREAAMFDATATDMTPRGETKAADAPAASAKPVDPTPPPPPSAPPANGGGLGSVAAALLGGVAGAAIAALVFYLSAPRDSSAELQARVAALDTRMKALAGADALAAIDKRLAAVEQQVRTAAAGASAADQAAKSADQTARTAAGAARSAEGLAAASASAVEAARQEARQEAQRLGAAIAGLPKPVAPVAAVDLTPLEARVTRAEDALAKVGQSAAQAAAQAVAAAVRPVVERLEKVEQRPVLTLKPVEDRLALVEQATRGAIDDAQRRIAAIEPKIAPPVDIKPVNDRLALLESRLAEQKSEARVTAAAEAAVGQAATRANSIAVAAQAATQALDRGAPYQVEVATMEGLGVDAAKLAPLKRYATTGAPTARKLAEAFAPLANAVAANAGPKDAPQGVGERLMSAAGRLVQIRRVGEAGDDPAALTSRIEAALARGATGDALAAWARLPGPAKALSQSFGSDLAGRVAADDAARAILGEAFAALGRKS